MEKHSWCSREEWAERKTAASYAAFLEDLPGVGKNVTKFAERHDL